MGGKVAMQLALQYPERLESLIVADMAPKENPQSHTDILDALCGADIGPEASRQSVEADLIRLGIPQPSVRQFLLKSLSRQASGQGFEWRFNLPLIRAQYPNILRNVAGDVPADIPALFVYGGQSDYLLPEDQPEILRRFPRAQFHCIPAAGHWLHAEAPDDFYAAVTGFLGAV
jgi:esterase